MTDRGRVRTLNEDAYVATSLEPASGSRVSLTDLATRTGMHAPARLEVGRAGALLAVSDGMGGAADGDIASSLAISGLVRALFGGDPDAAPSSLPQLGDDPRVRLEAAVQRAHRGVWEASTRAGQFGPRRMGATLTAVLVEEGTAHVAQIGDSRLYLLRSGVLSRVTHDQTVVQGLLDKGILAAEDVDHSAFRNILTQAIGHQENVAAVMSAVPLADRDLLLLCSDGLTSELTEREITDVTLGAPDLHVAATRLVERANDRGGKDNITVVLGGFGYDA